MAVEAGLRLGLARRRSVGRGVTLGRDLRGRSRAVQPPEARRVRAHIRDVFLEDEEAGLERRLLRADGCAWPSLLLHAKRGVGRVVRLDRNRVEACEEISALPERGSLRVNLPHALERETLWRGEDEYPAKELPVRAGTWTGGTTLAFVIELLEPATDSVAFRDSRIGPSTLFTAGSTAHAISPARSARSMRSKVGKATGFPQRAAASDVSLGADEQYCRGAGVRSRGP